MIFRPSNCGKSVIFAYFGFYHKKSYYPKFEDIHIGSDQKIKWHPGGKFGRWLKNPICDERS